MGLYAAAALAPEEPVPDKLAEADVVEVFPAAISLLRCCVDEVEEVGECAEDEGEDDAEEDAREGWAGAGTFGLPKPYGAKEVRRSGKEGC